MVLDDNGLISAAFKMLDMLTKSSGLCISATLGHYICAEVLEAPFRPLRSLNAATAHQGQESLRTSTNIILGEIYQKLSAYRRLIPKSDFID
jgi:hypothetical protein